MQPRFTYDSNLTPQQNMEALIPKINHLLATLDSTNVKRINTSETVIRSKDGETRIAGPLLLMYDKQVTPELRLRMGYDADSGKFLFQLNDVDGNNTIGLSDTGEFLLSGKPLISIYDNQDPAVLRMKMGYDVSADKFVFQMYDASGALTMSLNDVGEAVFSGNIVTAKNAYVGDNLYLGDVGQAFTTEKSIFFNGGVSISNYNDLYGYGLKVSCNTFRIEAAHIDTDNIDFSGNYDFSYATVTGIPQTTDQNASTGVTNIKSWTGTQTEYDALTPNNATLYYIKEA
jgi:hypothetical protein